MVVAYLNRVFGLMIGVIERHHGIVNQFLGDGFMATCGAPLAVGNHCENAVHAALGRSDPVVLRPNHLEEK